VVSGGSGVWSRSGWGQGFKSGFDDVIESW